MHVFLVTHSLLETTAEAELVDIAPTAKSSASKNFSHEALESVCSHFMNMSLQLLLVSVGLSILIISSSSDLKSKNIPISFQ